MPSIRHSNITTRSLKSPNTPLKASVVILTAVILAACGSSGGSSVTPKPIPMPPGSGTGTGGGSTDNGTGNNGGGTDNGTGNGGAGTGGNGSGTVTGPDTTEAEKQEVEALKAEAAAAKAAAEAAKAEVDAQILANSQTASTAQIEAARKAAAEAKARADAAEAAAKDARAKAEAEINKVVADSEARAKAAEEATKAAQAAKTKAEAAAAAEKAKAEAIKAKEAAEKALTEAENNGGSAGSSSEALQKEAERKAKLAKEAADTATAQANAATKAAAAAAAKESAAAAATKAATDAANAAKIKNAPEATKTGVQSLNVNGGALGVFSTTTRDFAVSKDGSLVEARADIASQDPKKPGTPGLLPKVSVVTSTANDTDLKDGFKEYKGNAEIVVAALGQTLPLDYVSTYKDFGDDMRIGHIDGGAEVAILSQTLPVNGVAVMGNATKAANVPTDGTAKYSGDATYRKLGLGNDIEFGKSVFTTDFVNKKVAGDLTFAKAGNIGISATIAGNKFAGSKDGYNTEGGFYGGDAQYLGGVYEGKDAQGTYGATNDAKKQALEAVQSTQAAAQAATKALEAAKAQAAAAQAEAAKAQADAAKAKADADKAQAAADNAGNGSGAGALQDALDRAAAAEAAQAAAEKAAKVAVDAARAEAAAAKDAATAAKAEANAKIAAAQNASTSQVAAANKAATEAKARADAAEAAAKSADARVKAAEAEVKAALEAKTSAEAQAKAAEAATKNAQAATNTAQAAKAKAEAATAAAEKAKAEAIKAKQDAEKALEEALSSGGGSEALQKEAERKAKLAKEAAAAASAQEAAATKAQAAATAKESAAAAAAKAATDAANAAKIKNAPEATKTGVQSLNVNGGALGVFSTTTRDFAVSKDGSLVEARADIASQDPKTPGTPGLLPKVSVITSTANDTNLQDGFKEYKGNAEIVVAAIGQTLPLEYVSTYKDFGDDMRIGHIDGGAEVKLLSQTLPVNGVAVMGNATQAANVPTDGTAKYSGDATYRKLGLGNDIELGKSVFTTDFVAKKVAGDLTFAKAGNIGISATIAGNKFAGSKDGYNTEGGFYGGDAQYLGGVYEGKDAQGTYGATSDKQTKAEQDVKSAQAAAQAATKALEAAKSQAATAQAAATKAQADAAKAKADADKAKAAAENSGNGADALQDALDRAAVAEAAQAAAERAATEAVTAAKAEAAAAKTAANAAKAEADAKVAAAEKLASQGNAAAAAANKAANEAKARADAAEAVAKDAETRAKTAIADAKKAADKATADAKARDEAEARATAAEKATQTAQAAKTKAEAAAAAAEKAKADAIEAKEAAEQALEEALSSGGSSEALQKEADRKAKLAKEAAAAAEAAATAQSQAAADAAAKATAAEAAKKAVTQAEAAAKIKNAAEANKTGVQSLNIDAKATLGTAFNTTTRDFKVNANGSIVEARADIASQLDPAEPGLLPKVSVTVSGANDANLQNGFKAHTDNAEIYVEALQQTLPLDYVSTYKDFGNDMRIAHIDGAANVELLGATLPVDGVAVLGNATQAANVPKEGSLKYSGDATYRELGLDNDIEFGKSVFTADFVGKKVAGDLNFAKAGNIGLSANIAGNKFSGTKGDYNTQGGFYGGDAQYIGGVYTSDKAQGTFGATSDKQTKAEEAVKTAQTQSQAATKALEAAQAQATATQAALEKAQADAVKAQQAAVKAQEAADNGGGGEDVLQAALDRAAAAEAAAIKAQADATKAVEEAKAAAAKAAATAQAEVKAAQAATDKAQKEAAAAKAATETAKTEAAAKVAAAQKAAKEDVDAANAAVIKAQDDLKAAEDDAIEAENKATAAEEAKLAAETRAKAAEDALAAAIKLPPTPKNPEVAADSTISGLQSNNMNGYQTNAVGGVVENNSSSFDILTSRVNELGSKYASTPVDLVLRNKAADSDYDEQFKQHSGKVSVKGTGELNEGVNRDLNYTSVYKNFDEVMQIGHVYGTIKRTLYEDGKLSTVYAQGKATNQKDMDYLKEAAQYNAKNGINDGKVDYEGVATYIANSNVAGPMVGDSKFKVDFVDQQVDGTLSFDSVGEKKIKAEITGNTFQGNWNGVNAQGGFYGEDAGLLGGIYQDSKGKGTYGASKITPEPVDPVEPEPEVPVDPTKPPINPTAAVDTNVSGIMSNTLSSKDKKVLNIQATVDRIGYRQFVNDKQTVTGVNGKDDNGGIPTVKESSKENNFIDYKTFKPLVDVTSPDQFVEANRDNITTVRSNDVDAGNGFKKSASKNVANFKNVQTGVSLAPTADLVLNYDSVYKNFNSQMQIGHVYGDLDKPSGTGSGISSRYSNVYAIGNSTAQADMDYMAALAKFNKANNIDDGIFKYSGVATYIDQLHLAEVANPTTSTPRNAPILNGTSAFDVDFVGGKVGGKLNFTGKPQIDIAADITGNTFAGTAKGIETAGGFFGEDAKFLGGIYQDNPGNGGAGGKAGTGTKFQGTFGAEKQ